MQSRERNVGVGCRDTETRDTETRATVTMDKSLATKAEKLTVREKLMSQCQVRVQVNTSKKSMVNV